MRESHGSRRIHNRPGGGWDLRWQRDVRSIHRGFGGRRRVDRAQVWAGNRGGLTLIISVME